MGLEGGDLTRFGFFEGIALANVLLFAEPFTGAQILGGALILLGCYRAAMSKR